MRTEVFRAEQSIQGGRAGRDAGADPCKPLWAKRLLAGPGTGPSFLEFGSQMCMERAWRSAFLLNSVHPKLMEQLSCTGESISFIESRMEIGSCPECWAG